MKNPRIHVSLSKTVWSDINLKFNVKLKILPSTCLPHGFRGVTNIIYFNIGTKNVLTLMVGRHWRESNRDRVDGRPPE